MRRAHRGAMMATYRVKAGRFGVAKQYQVGDLVELDPAHAVGFEDKLELVVSPPPPPLQPEPEEQAKPIPGRVKL